MHRLIKDLLALCRLDQTTDVGIAEVNLGAVVDSVKSNLELAIEDNAGVVTCQSGVIVRFNETRLLQLMQNLIANALKYRGEATPHVIVSAGPEGDDWHFTVKDNGIGIDPAYADRIFIIFQRLHGKEEYEGTGIGLAICKKIVEYHGGRIWVDTDHQDGTLIRFTLPADRPAVSDSAGPEPAADDRDAVEPADRTASDLPNQPVPALSRAEEPAHHD